MQEIEKNKGRQYNLDLLKALAIVCMILCHAVIRLGSYRAGNYHGEFWYIFADLILGGYIVVAHGFMFAMGVGMVYSKKNSPADLIHRGVNLFLLAYVLNFFRRGMYYLAEDLIRGAITEDALRNLFGPDILQFAGLALLATGIFKALKLKEKDMFYIGLILSMIGSVAAGIDMHNHVLNFLVGLFVITVPGDVNFSFCNWYLFVAVGLVFGKYLIETPDKDALYKKLLVISGVVAGIYLAATSAFGYFFLCKMKGFYDASPLEAFGLLSIDFFLLSLFHFLLKKVDVSKFSIPLEMSRNINTIYCIHWCIIGVAEFVFCHLLKLELASNYAVMYGFGIAVVIVSFLLARWYHQARD